MLLPLCLHQDSMSIKISFEEAQAIQRHGSPLPMALKREFQTRRVKHDASYACSFLSAFLIGNISTMKEVCRFKLNSRLTSLILFLKNIQLRKLRMTGRNFVKKTFREKLPSDQKRGTILYCTALLY